MTIRHATLRSVLSTAAWVAVALISGFTSDASANSMRCGSRHVDRGDTTTKVESLCGAPTSQRERSEIRVVRDAIQVACGPQGQQRCTRIVESHVTIQLQEWSYDLGPDRLIRNLLFENGVLQQISSGEYGTRK